MQKTQTFPEETAVRVRRSFSEDLKKHLVEQIQQGLITVSEVSREYGVTRASVYKWLRRYIPQYPVNVRQVLELDSEARKVEQLHMRIADLERIVGQKQLQIDVLQKVIELSSEELGIDLKKSVVTASSTTSENSAGKAGTQ